MKKRLKNKVLGNIISEQSLKGLCRYRPLNTFKNVFETFGTTWSLLTSVGCFITLLLIYFLIWFILPNEMLWKKVLKKMTIDKIEKIKQNCHDLFC